MPKQLSLFLFILLFVSGCFSGSLYVPKNEGNNSGDNLDDGQLKDAFALNMSVNWYKNDETTPGQSDPLVNVDIKDADYASPKTVSTTMGENNSLPDDPILGIQISQSANSNTGYTSEITATIYITTPDGKQVFNKVTINPKASYFFHIGSKNGTKGDYKIEVVATRKGNQGPLVYALPTVHINLLRHTDELYFTNSEEAMKALDVSIVYVNFYWYRDHNHSLVDKVYTPTDRPDLMSVSIGFEDIIDSTYYTDVMYAYGSIYFTVGVKLNSPYMKNLYDQNSTQMEYRYEYRYGKGVTASALTFTNDRIHITTEKSPAPDAKENQQFVKLFVTGITLKVDTNHYIRLKADSNKFLFSYGATVSKA